MEKFAIYLILFCSVFFTRSIICRTNANEAVRSLFERLLGPISASKFIVRIAPSEEENILDSFTLEGNSSHVTILANSPIAATYGFHYYLKYYCDCHISWDYDQLALPSILPLVNLTKRSLDRYRYYQNVCTYSYSFVWWDWQRWEREIDWMALNGINLALAFTGQEAIWTKVYKQLNLSDDDIAQHFTGAAYLAWNRMANIRGYNGPLSNSWMQDQLAMQKKIVRRMKELGIEPILPGFCGHLPRAMKRLYPNTKMIQLQSWNEFPSNYCCEYLLDPDEQLLFGYIGNLFYTTLEKEMGKARYHNCDIFNELRPSSSNPSYLKSSSAVVYNTLSKHNPDAIWVMQGWFMAADSKFWTLENAKHFLSGVPNSKMIVLDLQSELHPLYEIYHSYFGKPFIWCMLHNFGGTLGMHGSMDIINGRVVEARSIPNTTMVGVGLTPEGIHQNYVVYDFMLESAWRNESTDLTSWIVKYANRRYGVQIDALQEAWKLLLRSVYDYKVLFPLHGKYTLVSRPSLRLQPWTWYNTSDVVEAWNLFANVSHSSDVSTNFNYRYDLVDLTRQVIQNLFDKLYRNLVDQYYRSNAKQLANSRKLVLSLLDDLDCILSTNERFSLRYWIEAAKNKSATADETKLLEVNARSQISIWGPNGEIVDYAVKQWSGIVHDYFSPRWKLFIGALLKSLESGVPFRQSVFDQSVFESVEKPFTLATKLYKNELCLDTISSVNKFRLKWKKYYNSMV